MSQATHTIKGDIMQKDGILYGVGVGPGDPDMLTLKAVNVIKEADIICLPRGDKEKCRASLPTSKI